MYGKIKDHLSSELKSIEDAGLFKKERIITSPQGADIKLNTGQEVLNFCANNYLGLSNHPRLVKAAKVWALLQGRYNASLEDIRAVAKPALRHRLILNLRAEAEGIDEDDIITDILDGVPLKTRP